VSFRSDGKVGQATLDQKGQALGISGVVRPQTAKPGGNAIVVELLARERRLSQIQLSDLIFDLIPVAKRASLSAPEQVEKLALTEATLTSSK
jgi:hypothetical protein